MGWGVTQDINVTTVQCARVSGVYRTTNATAERRVSSPRMSIRVVRWSACVMSNAGEPSPNMKLRNRPAHASQFDRAATGWLDTQPCVLEFRETYLFLRKIGRRREAFVNSDEARPANCNIHRVSTL